MLINPIYLSCGKKQKSVVEMKKNLPDIFVQRFSRSIILSLVLKGIKDKNNNSRDRGAFVSENRPKWAKNTKFCV